MNYKLDGHDVVPCEDPLEWAKWFGTADRVVAKTETGRGDGARSEAVAREAQEETQKVASELVSQGFSVRDVGELLDVSHQRVQQLVKG